ncbi:hypothetical protein [Methylotuvimicrobium alcaliphilum]|jgi:type II secretory pathway pseudopilin PulG|uniref:Prepilin-type N-terminal cleavage/methylation domain-containing protein n=1 Tax=Methylotuvimicrobium alcaliphilum (strain DSM 19304 / NCIMB 14124 / VKM B-2133 / 20Z) TaxID=1091494 RepID=G4SYG7_META2|nr:hypothetical protein [Methylotuvimicrobium alcaliphilum]CCE22168.1 protein of unknown function [Methylotuvimicrobium alcaliphilum 20Z]
MKDYKVKRIARQAGLTLIELTVVLLILIGLAGLMLPYVGGFVDKTHDSANSDSLVEVSKAIQRYDVQFMGQPKDYDSLIVQDTAGEWAAGTLYPHMMNAMGSGYLQVTSVPANALKSVGITSLLPMDATADDKTFDAALPAVALPAINSDPVAVAALRVNNAPCAGVMGCIDGDAALAKILGRPVGSIDTSAKDYVAFGVGQGSGMVGKTISEAPVHFAKTGAMSAANKYNRILAIYEVPRAEFCEGGTRADPLVPAADQTDCESDTGNMSVAGTWRELTPMERRAKFLTTVMPMMRLEGLGGALSNHYQNVDG